MHCIIWQYKDKIHFGFLAIYEYHTFLLPFIVTMDILLVYKKIVEEKYSTC